MAPPFEALDFADLRRHLAMTSHKAKKIAHPIPAITPTLIPALAPALKEDPSLEAVELVTAAGAEIRVDEGIDEAEPLPGLEVGAEVMVLES